jgi:hypothetical protein
MSTGPENSPPKKQSKRLQLTLLAAQLLLVAALVCGAVASKWERDERTKQLKRLERLGIEIKQLEKAVDERDKRAGEKQPNPAKAKPAAAGNKASQLHRLDWPGERLVDDRLAMPAVSWTASVLA